MSPEAALTEEAHSIGRALSGLKPDDNELRERLLAAAMRYRPRINARELVCPNCWMRHEKQSTLRSVPGTDDYDVLRCNANACGAEFIVPF